MKEGNLGLKLFIKNIRNLLTTRKKSLIGNQFYNSKKEL